MKLIINESQCKILIEQLKSPNPQEIANMIWSSVSGVGTDEEKMYSALKLMLLPIKSMKLLGQISNLKLSSVEIFAVTRVKDELYFPDSIL